LACPSPVEGGRSPTATGEGRSLCAGRPGRRQPRRLRGRRRSYSRRQSSMTPRASVSVCSGPRLRHPSRNRPWKLSTKPFCHGLPGSSQRVVPPPPRAHLRQPEPLPPPLKRCFREVPLLAHLPDRSASGHFPQDPDLPLRRGPLPSHRLGPSWLRPGLSLLPAHFGGVTSVSVRPFWSEQEPARRDGGLLGNQATGESEHQSSDRGPV
jgi:hypothetical protein